MTEKIQSLFDVTMMIQDYGYVGISIITFLENGIFFLLPGDSLLFAAGLFAQEGLLNIFLVILLVIIFTTLGSVAGYFIGKYLNEISNIKYLKKIFHADKIEKAKIYFVRHGDVAIIYAKFFPIFRTFVPIFAGFSKMNFYKFIKYTIFGATLWATSITFAGYFLGKMFPSLIDNITKIGILIVIVSLLPIAYKYMKNKHF